MPLSEVDAARHRRNDGMTVAARCSPCRFRMLMEPELPLLVRAGVNLLVSPVCGSATMAGLMALACAWCASHGWPAYLRGYRHGARW